MAMPSNVRLENRARRLLERARMRSRQSGQTEHVYGATWYAARSGRGAAGSSSRPRWNGIMTWRCIGRAAHASWPTSSSCSLTAYTLFQQLRRRAGGTACAGAQVTTLREHVLKLAVWVERSARRIVLHFPLSFPWPPTWRQLAGATS